MRYLGILILFVFILHTNHSHPNEVSLFVPPEHQLISIEKYNIDGKRYHKNLGTFTFQNLFFEFEEVIEINNNQPVKIIYNEQKYNGNVIQEFSIFDERKNIYAMHKIYKDTFLPSTSYFCVFSEVNGCRDYKFIHAQYSRDGKILTITNYSINENEKNLYLNKLVNNISLIKKKFEPVDVINDLDKIKNLKEECESLGFEKNSKKFKDCIIKLL